MHFYFAGAKPASKAHKWDDPRIPAEPSQIDVMLTYFEFQGRKQNANKQKFLKSLARGRKAGKRK